MFRLLPLLILLALVGCNKPSKPVEAEPFITSYRAGLYQQAYDQAVGPNSVRDAKRALYYGAWLEASQALAAAPTASARRREVRG